MASYHSYKVGLSDGQKQKLAKAYKSNSPVTIRLKVDELIGDDELMLTKTQLKKIRKAINNGTGVDVKISKAQIRKAVKYGGSLWSSLLSLGTRMLPVASKLVSKAVPSLASGALSALGSLGIDKIFGKGYGGNILPNDPILDLLGYGVPNDKINRLIEYGDLLSTPQKKQILNALQTGSGVVIKPTTKQRGGFLGTLLATIGVPLLLKALTGSGLQVDQKRSRRSVPVYIPPPPPQKLKKGGLHQYPVDPPPFFGTWDQMENPIGMGAKKKGQGFILGPNSPLNGIPILGDIF